MSNWILHSAKTIGRDHVRSNIVCQDDVKTLEKNGVSVIALSDGCGSAPFAEHGSSVTVEFLCNVFAENFDEIFKKDVADIKKYLHLKLPDKNIKMYFQLVHQHYHHVLLFHLKHWHQILIF